MQSIKNSSEISKIEIHKFNKYEVFTVTPVISWEYACRAHIDNPYYKLITNKTPNLIVFQTKNFQVWEEVTTKIRLSDKKIIEQINQDSLNFVKKNEQQIQDFLNSNLDVKKALKGMKFLNNQCFDLYRTYLFYTEEYFDTHDTDLLRILPEIRMKLSEFVDLIWKAYNKILEFIQKQGKFTIKQLERATSKEIIAILQGKKVEISENRPLAFTIINNEFKEYFDKEASEIEKFLEKQDSKQQEIQNTSKEIQISGRPAYKGKAKGRVIKITEDDYKNYNEKFKNNEKFILVSPMTRPEIVPYLKNAAAIVTDEGGITCHAAIVARELEIPCIVGTEIATKVLNDNDLVEVDAVNGKVKILKKNDKIR